MGWYEDAKLNIPFNWSHKLIRENIQLFAAWEAYKLTVIFRPEGASGTVPPTLTYSYGYTDENGDDQPTIITFPQNPFTITGKTFLTWRVYDGVTVNDESFVGEVHESDISAPEELSEFIRYGNATVIVTPSWITQRVYLSLILNGGTTIGQSVIEFLYGDKVLSLPTTEKEGSLFGGWFTDNVTFKNPFVLGDFEIKSNTQIYAKWLTPGDGNGGDPKTPSEFPWWIIFLILAIIIVLVVIVVVINSIRRKKSASKEPYSPRSTPQTPKSYP
jgi:hypothetical protein